MESHESFEIMADFAENVDSRELRDSLINALNKKHPFQKLQVGCGQFRTISTEMV